MLCLLDNRFCISSVFLIGGVYMQFIMHKFMEMETESQVLKEYFLKSIMEFGDIRRKL